MSPSCLGGSEGPSAPSLMAVYLDRGIRALLIVGAALLLAHAWGSILSR